MNRYYKTSCMLCAALLWLPGSAGAEKSVYRWVDENGKVHYGDTVPPEESKQDRDVLNEHGVAVDRLEGAKTPEEIAAERRRREQKERQRRRAREQAEQDRMLLKTFRNEADIVATRDAKVEAIENIIQVSTTRIKSLKRRLSALIDAAAERERSGKTVPASLQRDIDQVHSQIKTTQNFIAEKRGEQDALRKRYERYIERYRELMAQREEPEGSGTN